MTPAQARLWAALRQTGEFRPGNYRCPAHKDTDPSLSVGYDDGKVLFNCKAGCDQPRVLKALGLTWNDLFDDGPPQSMKDRIVAEYNYTDEDGRLLFQTVRFEPKGFRQRHPDPSMPDGWSWNLNGTRRVPFNLPKVLAAVRAGEPVWVAEGEKDVLALERAGVVATCNPMGAGKWYDKWNYSQYLAGATVTVVADRDQAGRDHAAKVAESLRGVGCSVRVVEPAVNREHADAADHLAAGLGLEDFVEPGSERPPKAESESDEEPIFPAPSNPLAVARQLIDTETDPPLRDANGDLLARWWRGGFYYWTGTHWAESAKVAVEARLYRVLEHARYRKGDDLEPWAPTRRKIEDLYDALLAIVHLDERTEAPSWIGEPGPLAGKLVVMRNGLLDLESRTLTPHTPRLFNLAALPYDYDPDAGDEPKLFLQFLGQLWPDDPESIALLQEWFGYVVSGETNQHKILGIFGPPRSGKGTIARVLTALVGRDNMAGPTLASLGTNFGLAPLIGKTLAIVSDARLGANNPAAVVERLLSISGEDALTVDVKYRSAWTGRLGCRFVVVSNELPNLGDASGAVATRFRILTLAKSWLGHEDKTLTEKLLEELPAIFNWSLRGLERLQEQGYLTEPQSSRDAVMALADLTSPTAAFVREWAEKSPEHECPVARAYQAWRLWCAEHGRRPTSEVVFGRDLRAAVPGLKRVQVGGRDEKRVWHYRGLRLRADAEARVEKEETRWSRPPEM
jgi:putative DNA primase/helicase